jgi:hypothetical protein
LTAIDLRLNPFPKINRIRLPHPCWPPSIPASILNQTSDSLGIPFRFLFHARRSRVGLVVRLMCSRARLMRHRSMLPGKPGWSSPVYQHA